MNTRETTRRDHKGGIVAVDVYDDTGTLLATRTPRRDSKGNLIGWTTTQTEAGQLAHEREARRATAGPIKKLRADFADMLRKAVGAARREGKRVGYEQGFADGEAAQRKRDRAMFEQGARAFSRAVYGYEIEGLNLSADEEDDPLRVTLEDRPRRTHYRSDELRPVPAVSVHFEDGRPIYRQEREP